MEFYFTHALLKHYCSFSINMKSHVLYRHQDRFLPLRAGSQQTHPIGRLLSAHRWLDRSGQAGVAAALGSRSKTSRTEEELHFILQNLARDTHLFMQAQKGFPNRFGSCLFSEERPPCSKAPPSPPLPQPSGSFQN